MERTSTAFDKKETGEFTANRDASGSTHAQAQAEKTLRASFRGPSKPLGRAWYALSGNGRDGMDLNALLPMIGAWRRVDPAVAAALAQTALDVFSAGGTVSRYWTPDRESAPPQPWPLLARAVWRAGAEAVSDTTPDETLEYVRSYLSWALKTYDPDGSAQPRWPSAEEAFIPETWDEDLFPVDLAAFLGAEFEAFDRIQADLGLDTEDPPEAPHGYREALSEHLHRFLWDPKRRCFSDRYRSGKRISRITLSSAIPLMMTTLPGTLLEGSRRWVQAGSPLRTSQGLALWEPWPDDPAPPPCPVLQQAILYDALCAPGFDREKLALDQVLRSNLEPLFTAPASDRKQEAGTGAEPLNAAVAVRAGVAPDTSADSAPAWIRWLDRNTRIILLSLSAFFVLLGITVLTVPRFFPRSGEGPTIETLAGLAQTHYRDGQYEDAERLFSEVLTRSRLPMAVFRQGNVLFRQGRFSEAESYYREAMQHPSIEVQARFNLAQSIIGQGNNEEARRHLEEIIDRHAQTYPEVAQLATTALRLMEQSELLETISQ